MVSDALLTPPDGIQTEESSHRQERRGSSVLQASLNFTNSIVGAGSVGFGGAIAQSGGFLGISIIILFAALAKVSCDLVIRLALLNPGSASYEALGLLTYGQWGLAVVALSKFLFCFGCLVAYIVIVKENFASACRHLLGVELLNDNLTALVLSIMIVLPLSLLRDLTPLARFSALKIGTYLSIIVIVIYLFFVLPADDDGSIVKITNFEEHWLTAKPEFVPNMGTFVFALVTQHMVHMIYHSLKSQTLETWKQISSLSILLATAVMMTLGVFVYMTFWERTDSDMFLLYPALPIVDVARILLCLTIMLTYPMPFFAARELIIIALPEPKSHEKSTIPDEEDALLSKPQQVDGRWWLVPGEERQLKGPYHVSATVVLWALSVGLALSAPSLGDVLNVVGCVAGSLIGFILPALFSYRIEGMTFVGSLLFVVGVFVGIIGTFYSSLNLIRDSLA